MFDGIERDMLDILGWFALFLLAVIAVCVVVVWRDGQAWQVRRVEQHRVEQTDTRSTLAYFMHVGSVLVPMYVTEHRWICDDGDAWRGE